MAGVGSLGTNEGNCPEDWSSSLGAKSVFGMSGTLKCLLLMIVVYRQILGSWIRGHLFWDRRSCYVFLLCCSLVTICKCRPFWYNVLLCSSVLASTPLVWTIVPLAEVMHTTPAILAASHASISQSKTQVKIQHWELATEISTIFGRHKKGQFLEHDPYLCDSMLKK